MRPRPNAYSNLARVARLIDLERGYSLATEDVGK